MTDPKRPLLTTVDRGRIRQMANKARENGQTSHNKAYSQGVRDVLLWLDNAEMSPLMREITQ